MKPWKRKKRNKINKYTFFRLKYVCVICMFDMGVAGFGIAIKCMCGYAGWQTYLRANARDISIVILLGVKPQQCIIIA